jgi:hypothetical protein
MTTVKCANCGQPLSFPEERIPMEDGSCICYRCYQDILFPHAWPNRMESLDEARASSR